MLLAALTLLFPLSPIFPASPVGRDHGGAVQHIDPWTKQLVMRLMTPGAPQRAAIMLDLAVAMFVSVAVDSLEHGARGFHRHRSSAVPVHRANERVAHPAALPLRWSALTQIPRRGREMAFWRPKAARYSSSNCKVRFLRHRGAAGADHRHRRRSAPTTASFWASGGSQKSTPQAPASRRHRCGAGPQKHQARVRALRRYGDDCASFRYR